MDGGGRGECGSSPLQGWQGENGHNGGSMAGPLRALPASKVPPQAGSGCVVKTRNISRC